MRFLMAGILVAFVILAALAGRVLGRSGSVSPRWGEIGVLALCTAWFLGVVLFGTPLDGGVSFLVVVALLLTAAVGVFWGLHLAWSASNGPKRWVGYGALGGALLALLFL